MVSCGYCRHAGIHVEVMPPSGGRTRCRDCPTCQQEIATERQAAEEARTDERPDSSARARAGGERAHDLQKHPML